MTLLNNILPEQRRGKLKALLEAGKTVRVLEAHNGLSGIIANTAEVTGESDGQAIVRQFDAIWESSLTDSASKGHPDIEVVTFDSRLHSINEILAVTDKPMIVDGDTGGDANAFCGHHRRQSFSQTQQPGGWRTAKPSGTGSLCPKNPAGKKHSKKQ